MSIRTFRSAESNGDSVIYIYILYDQLSLYHSYTDESRLILIDDYTQRGNTRGLQIWAGFLGRIVLIFNSLAVVTQLTQYPVFKVNPV